MRERVRTALNEDGVAGAVLFDGGAAPNSCANATRASAPRSDIASHEHRLSGQIRPVQNDLTSVRGFQPSASGTMALAARG